MHVYDTFYDVVTYHLKLNVLGVFEPPFDGVYLLTAYAVSYNLDGPMYIKNNDVVLCSTWITHAGTETTTCSAVAQLAIGDSVRVTGESDNPATIDGKYACGFVGHIISH